MSLKGSVQLLKPLLGPTMLMTLLLQAPDESGSESFYIGDLYRD